MIRRLGLVSVVVALAACSDSVSVGNDNPSGAVGGVVVDAVNEMPLAGAMVKVVSPTVTRGGTTDMNGAFNVGGVPAGGFIVTIAETGFVSATFAATLGGAVGNFPVHNPAASLGPIGLVRSDGSLTVRIVDESGAPVAGVHAIARPQVRYIDYASGGPIPRGATELAATTGADGAALFTGVPDFGALGLDGIVDDRVLVSVAPTQVAGAHPYAFFGGTFTFALDHLDTTAPTITLAGPHTDFRILASNIDYLKNVSGAGPPFTAPVGSLVPANGPITIAFNEAVDPASLRAQLFTDGGALAPTQPSPAMVQGNLVAITPAAPLVAGQRYNLSLHAASAYHTDLPDGVVREVSVVAPFFTEQPAGATVNVVAATEVPGRSMVVTFSEPVGVGRGSAAPVSCAAFYEGADFDANPGNVYQGDWSPASYLCGLVPGGGPGLDVTAMYPIEAAPGMPLTGFATRWRVVYDDGGGGGCRPGLPTPPCVKPVSGATKVHLALTRVPAATTVKRVTGAPVGDLPAFVLP